MANKNQEPISRWGCAKAIAFSGLAVVFLAVLIDGCDNPKKTGSTYSTVLVWIYIIVVIYVGTGTKFKKGWFD